MKVVCPNCQGQVDVDPARWSGGARGMVQVDCPLCQSILRLALKVESVKNQVQATSNMEKGGVASAPAHVLVAVDGEATREIIREILVKSGYGVLEAVTGRESLSLLEKHHPPLAILDVGLPQMFGFEVCEVIKRHEGLKSVKVILVAAIHDKNSYKREPRSLYGADDYIERHRLQDELVVKIESLLVKQATVAEAAKAAIQPPASPVAGRPVAVIQEKPKAQPPPSKTEKQTATVSSPEHEAARRLARIIVSDIALYNSDKVKEALKQNSFSESLKQQIEEGRKLYNERVSAAVRSATDYFQEALDNYIKTHSKNP